MKTIQLLTLMTFSTIVLANNPWEQFPEREEGINIIPTSQKQEKYFLELQTNGYIKEHNKNALSLIQEVSKAANELRTFSNNNDPRSTHLRPKAEDIKFAFTFPEVKYDDATKIYGFAPLIAYSNNQWTGGTELFESKFGFSCKLNVNAAKLNHSSVFISEKNKTNKVNGKVTTQLINGDDKYGYIYIVSWYDDTYFRDLECASNTLDLTVLDKMIEIAKRADS